MLRTMREISAIFKKALILICLFSLGIVPLNEIVGQPKIPGIIYEQPDKNTATHPVELLSPWTKVSFIVDRTDGESWTVVGTKPKVEGSNRVLVATVNGKSADIQHRTDVTLTYGGIR
jgi:hypothetical protein